LPIKALDRAAATPPFLTGTHLLAYLGGIIDGEGSVGYYQRGPKSSSQQPVFYISVGMTYKPIIDLLHLTFGGRVQPHKVSKVHYKPQWYWRVTHATARKVYFTIEPYLILKRVAEPHERKAGTTCRSESLIEWHRRRIKR
jgi:hypothetical protein